MCPCHKDSRNFVEIICTNYYLIYFVRFGRFGVLEFATENQTENFGFLYNKIEIELKFLHRFGQFESVFSVHRFFAHP